MRCARLLLVLAGIAAGRELELHGVIEPAPASALVTLRGSDFPFHAETISGPNGRFQFKRLVVGAYNVSVFVPGAGEVLRTVAVSESLADAKGRVTVKLPFAVSNRSLGEQSKVSLRELAVPARAKKEYSQAEKSLHKHDVDGAIRRL